MRVINLDETGVKIISATKRQMYLTPAEIKDFLAKKYEIRDNVLFLNKKSLPLCEKDMQDFQNTIMYLESHFENV